MNISHKTKYLIMLLSVIPIIWLLSYIFGFFLLLLFPGSGGATNRVFESNHYIIEQNILIYKSENDFYPENFSDIENLLIESHVDLDKPYGATYELFMDGNGDVTLSSKYKKILLTIVFNEDYENRQFSYK